MKRIFPVLVAVVLSVTTFTGLFGNDHFFVEVAEAASGDFGGGDGSEENPYLIEDVWDLQNMTSDLNAHYIMVNDIDASITSSWNGGAGFKPIGNGTAYFNGTFDGGGFRICNLTINRSSEDHVGLFGFLNVSVIVEDLGLECVNITGKNQAGGFAGNNHGTIENCYTTGITTGTSYLGGFAGSNHGTIENCYSTGNADGIGNRVGGFAGYNDAGTINNCYSTGNARGFSFVGSLAGWNEAGTITNCYGTGNASSISGTGELIGGFAGYNYRGTFTNCYSTGSATGNWYVGGFTGNNHKGTLINCYSTGNANGTGYRVGGFTGYNDMGIITNCFSTGDTNASGDHTGGFTGYNDLGTINNCYSTGYASGVSNYVGGFAGTNYGGTIDDCYSTGNTSGDWDVGGFVGWNRGTVSNCYSTGNASGVQNAGGFAGYIDYGTVSNCYCTGNTRGDLNTGGFIGHNNGGTVTNCYATGKTNTTGDHTGGFAGLNEAGTIANCYSTGSVRGTGYATSVGGFAGYNYRGTIANCYSTGNANGLNHVGGFTGENEATITNCYSTGNANGTGSEVGGFVGMNRYGDALIISCYTLGNAIGDRNVGGFVGYSHEGTIKNSYSKGNASGSGDYVGGFAGRNQVGGTIENCYSIGNATGSADYVGGFAGKNLLGGIITNCFWDTQTSGTTTGIGGGTLTGATGKTTAEMMKMSTFSPPWDFDSIWGLVGDTTYPFLTTFIPITFIPITIDPITFNPIVTTRQIASVDAVAEDNRYMICFEATAQPLPSFNKIETWNIVSNASWLSLYPFNGILSGTPGNDDVGTYYVKVSAVDSMGSRGYFEYELTVMNTAPDITTGDIFEVVSGNLYYNDYDSTDDGQGTITWSMETNATWLNPISSSGTLTGIPSNDDAGTYWVYILVDDGNGGTDSTNFTFEVKLDTDLDGIPDDEDDDDDNDGVIDVEDDFPLDPNEWTDTDGDGTGDNADTDDDGDGWLDDLERTLGTDPLDNMSVPSDMDGDGIADLLDDDKDGDGYSNQVDAFPENSGEWQDSDMDGIGDNSDEYPFDRDNDGYNDTVDAFPMDPTKWDPPVVNNTVYENNTVVEYKNRTLYDNNTVYDNETIYNNQTITPPMGDIYLNDTDGDGMPDSWELLYGLDPEDPSDASLDPDEDGISNLYEYKGGTSPTSADVEPSDAGGEAKTPTWAWLALVAAIVLGLIAVFFAIQSRRQETAGNEIIENTSDHEE